MNLKIILEEKTDMDIQLGFMDTSAAPGIFLLQNTTVTKKKEKQTKKSLESRWIEEPEKKKKIDLFFRETLFL